MERVEEALADLGHPERSVPAVHVAGTNGKGSTCAFISRALQCAGLKVGLYTSPHLVRFHERIQVNGRPIDDGALGARALEVLERYSRRDERPFPLTSFELGTLVAFRHFAEERADVAVLETGMGGRLDATNCCRPWVTAITPISFDHVEWLGSTLDAIAREKAGILKPGVPAVSSAQRPEALEVLQSAAPLILQGREFDLDQAMRFRGRRWSIEDLELSLRGPHQRQNAAVALACLEVLADRGLEVTPDAAREGLRTARWPGRLEELGPGPDRPLVVLDGAHNAAGAEALAAALDALYPGRRIHAVFSVLADKDLEGMARALFPRFASLHLCPLPSPRSLPPAAYADRARALCPDVRLCPGPAEALAGASGLALAQGGLVLACGSLVLVGAVRALGER
ncbi:MAG TPA: folylpolyglutamate synthase/dihydrofolate synthase family protein [Myxococcales bacterium]|nr:folylpolyglutamate synthase/dihydrofolate synthase family protein [Myxococcales bacterium]